VLERPGHTEAAVDLARLAGRAPAGVLSELVLDDGRMARLPELHRVRASEHALPLISIADLIAFRLAHPNHVHPSHDPLSPITPHAGALA
jgi:3,4-dihydroxy 2-butanone 4-phosphate synthase/GTP cyclohydrolase II